VRTGKASNWRKSRHSSSVSSTLNLDNLDNDWGMPVTLPAYNMQPCSCNSNGRSQTKLTVSTNQSGHQKCKLKPKFHYADFATSRPLPQQLQTRQACDCKTAFQFIWDKLTLTTTAAYMAAKSILLRCWDRDTLWLIVKTASFRVSYILTYWLLTVN